MDDRQLYFLGIEPPQKKQSRRDQLQSNDIAKRLIWVRENLELRPFEVCKDLGLPSSTFCDRESGVRTCYYEEINALANYYDEKWQKRYLETNYPKYKDQEIEAITLSWVLLGFDDVVNEYKKTVEILNINHKEKEKLYIKQIKGEV